MSATVMYYPQKYLELMDVVRGRLLEGRPASWAPNLKIGLQVPIPSPPFPANFSPSFRPHNLRYMIAVVGPALSSG